MPAPQRSDRTPPRAPARPEGTSDSAPRRDLASEVPLVAYEASGDAAELLATAQLPADALQPDAVREALRVGKTIRREAAGKGATAEWSAAVDAFLAASTVTAPTRQQYRCHLFAAGTVFGWRPLVELTEYDLLAFRAALLADGRAGGTHLVALLVVRCFLVWAWEQGWIGIDREVFRVVLQGWDSRRKGPLAPAGSGRSARPSRAESAKFGPAFSSRRSSRAARPNSPSRTECSWETPRNRSAGAHRDRRRAASGDHARARAAAG